MVQPLLTWWNALFLAAAILLAAYLIGSIPTAWLLARRLIGQDLRQLGDGNVGAENAARILGRKAGFSVAVIDIGKGLAVILTVRGAAAAGLLGSTTPGFPLPESYSQVVAMLAGAVAVVGHSWPVYLRGPGGRGAATAAGVLLGLTPASAWLMVLPALAVIYLTRSATRTLATFFVGNVALAAAFSYYGLFGYFWIPSAYTFALPILVSVIHWLSVRRRVDSPSGMCHY